MPNTLLPRLTAFALTLLLSPVAFGCWIAVAPEVLIDQADLIVRGEVVQLVAVPGKPDPGFGARQVAIIRVDAVLKDNAPPTDGKPPRAKVRLLQMAEVRLSTTLRRHVKDQFLANVGESDADKIEEHREAAVRGISNYMLVRATELAQEQQKAKDDGLGP